MFSVKCRGLRGCRGYFVLHVQNERTFGTWDPSSEDLEYVYNVTVSTISLYFIEKDLDIPRDHSHLCKVDLTLLIDKFEHLVSCLDI